MILQVFIVSSWIGQIQKPTPNMKWFFIVLIKIFKTQEFKLVFHISLWSFHWPTCFFQIAIIPTIHNGIDIQLLCKFGYASAWVGGYLEEGWLFSIFLKKSFYRCSKKPSSVLNRNYRTLETLTYASNITHLSVRGRIIWGGLVRYEEVWVTGAHNATSLK